MLRRIIPLLLLTFTFFELKAQVPETATSASQLHLTSAACNGTVVDAGTSTQSISQALFPTNQSSDIRFLCLGDSMDVDHSGGITFDDGDPSTIPGYSYIFYRCPPSAAFDGEDEATILMDPCHYEPAPATSIVMVIPGNSIITADGDATFLNNGGLQGLPENMGEPTSIWFAPLTVDNFDIPGQTIELLSCIDVNTDDAFNVVYLNEIEISNVNNNVAGNGCQGSMTITGGYSEWLELSGEAGPDDYTVTITKVGDPSVTGIVLPGWEHRDTNTFRVPEAGTYLIEVEDGVSCGASTTINMGGCVPVNFFIGDSLSVTGNNICMPVTVSDFVDITSFQFLLNWDNSILRYTGTSPGDLDLANFNIATLPLGSPFPDTMFVSWSSTFDFMTGTFELITLNDDDVAFNICFDVIGTSGVSPIIFLEEQREVGTADAQDGSPKFKNGSVTIISNILNVDVGGCSTPAGMTGGSIQVLATGGVAPYTISYVEVGNASNTGVINGSAGTEEFMGLVPGNYLVTVTDSNGEVQVVPVTIAAAPEFFVDMQTQRPSCNGAMDGSISADIFGGVMPYDIQWSTGDMNVITVSGLPSGSSYMLTVTDANGCSDVADRPLSQPTAITLDTLIQHETCNMGPNDGSISLQNIVGGPSTNYTFLWDNGLGTASTVSGLSPGTYCVEVTSVGMAPDPSCTRTFCIVINPANPPTIVDFTEIPISCPGLSDGTLTVNITPGNGTVDPMDIDWGAAGTGPTITGLPTGTYSVTVTASDGCTATDSYILSAGGLTVELDSVPPTCSYDATGQVLATVNGAIGTLSYSWSTGSTSTLLTNLVCDQIYSVTVTDSGSGCTEGTSASIEIPCPQDILIVFDTLSITPVRCDGLTGGACDGSVTVVASAGTTMSGDYNFRWDISPETQTGGSIHTAGQLCQGLNTITVNDQDCAFSATIDIPAPDPISLDASSTDIVPVSCNGRMDGSATIAATGGTPIYDYAWSTTDTGPMVSGLAAGPYTVTITDMNSCPHIVNIEIDEPDPLVAFVSPVNTKDASCNGSEDGVIEIAWTGGNIGDPTTYEWTDNVSTNNIATNLAAGPYSITVTDRKGCSAVVPHVVSNPPPIRFTLADVVAPPCFGETTVIQIDQAFGGAGGPFDFSVGGAKRGTDQAIRVLAGEITVTVFDADGCTADTTILVTQPPEILVNLGPDLEEIDLGSSIEIDANISPPGLQLDELFWSPNVALQCTDFIGNDTSLCNEVTVSPLTTTVYTLSAVDVNGCEGSSSITIEVDKNRNVFIPNAFSPNGDGFNDEFRVLGGAGVEGVNSMRVFDRWGELVYQALNFEPKEGSDEFWNGRFGNTGKLMNPGVYV